MTNRYLMLLTTLAFLGLSISVPAFAGKVKNCDPNAGDVHPSCGDDGGLGSAIPMKCLLGASWGDDPGDTINDDTVGWSEDTFGWYEDAVDRVTCSIEGPSVPWPIYMKVWRDKGKPPNLVRKVDVVLGDIVKGEFDSDGWTVDNLSLRGLYEDFFDKALGVDGPNMEEMDALRLNVRPYRDDLAQTTESIHRLEWKAEGYEMGMHFGKPDTGIDRFAISIASQHYPGNEKFTGIACEIDDPDYVAKILASSPELEDLSAGRSKGAMRDVSVYLWRDTDEDGLPDGYTVTTGEFGVITKDLDGPPEVEPGARWAAVCSAVGDKECGNPKAPSNCNFHGYVEVRFTLHACASELLCDSL